MYGKLDITFYRDDIRKQLHAPNQTDITFSLEDKNVILIDDLLLPRETMITSSSLLTLSKDDFKSLRNSVKFKTSIMYIFKYK